MAGEEDAPRQPSKSRIVVEKTLKKLDRWGEAPTIPRTVVGGILTLMMVICVGVYAVIALVNHLNKPPQVTTEVKWSAALGPYPMDFKCYFDFCWVSVEYSTELERKGQSHACAEALSANQTKRCLEFRNGEVIKISSCYSLLPNDGLRIHFAGQSHWNSSFGLRDEAEGQFYGLTIASDMNSATGEPMPMPSPLRAGVLAATYVHTLNTTLAEDRPGHERHEWFIQPISTEIPASDLSDDPCVPSLLLKNASLIDVRSAPVAHQCSGSSLEAILPGSMLDCSAVGLRVHSAVLRMAPWFTEVTVSKEELWTLFLEYTGELGGLAALVDLALLCLVMLYAHEVRRRLPALRLSCVAGEDSLDHSLRLEELEKQVMAITIKPKQSKEPEDECEDEEFYEPSIPGSRLTL